MIAVAIVTSFTLIVITSIIAYVTYVIDKNKPKPVQMSDVEASLNEIRESVKALSQKLNKHTMKDLGM